VARTIVRTRASASAQNTHFYTRQTIHPDGQAQP